MLLPTRGGYAFATPLLREAAYAGVGKADLADRHARLVRWAAGLSAPVPSSGWTADTLDAFIAEQAERAANLADAVSLRPEAPARSVAPLGVAALGRLARRAIRAGEPGQAAALRAQRALAWPGVQLPSADRLVLASALLQLGRAPEALDDAEKIAADVRHRRPGEPARALLLAGRAYRVLGDTERGDQAWAEALAGGHRRLTSPPSGPRRCAASAWRSTGAVGCARRRQLPSRRWPSPRSPATGAARRGPCRTWPGSRPRSATSPPPTRPSAAPPGSSPSWATPPVGPGCAAPPRSPGCSPAGCTRPAAWRTPFLPFGERVGERWAVGTLRAVDAFAAAELGDLAAADREARRAYHEFDEIDDDWGRAFALVVRGVVARGLGEPEHAIDLLADACRYGERTGHPLLLGMAHTIRGFALLDAGDPAAAEADAHTVLAVIKPHDVVEAARVGPRVLLGCARLALGRRRRGPRRPARGRRADSAAIGAAVAPAGRGRVRVGAARRRSGRRGGRGGPAGGRAAGRGRAQPGRRRPGAGPGAGRRPGSCGEARAAAAAAVADRLRDPAGQRAARRRRGARRDPA